MTIRQMTRAAELTDNALQTGKSQILAHQLACMEVWGGNAFIDSRLVLPGMTGWIHSKPLEPATFGGDVYYLSVCSAGLLSRVVLADVAGHGQVVGSTAGELRDLVRKNIIKMDQSELMRGINEAFRNPKEPGSQYATAAVLGYYSETCDLIYANAGHPPPLWYRASRASWEWLLDHASNGEGGNEGLPLGLIPGTRYRQTVVRLGAGDRLVLYTDGVTESLDPAGNELGSKNLLQMMPRLPIESCSTLGEALLSNIESRSAEVFDDLTILVLGT
jgi:serine phosphatase RsbU (regulator of sigma subunit)